MADTNFARDAVRERIIADPEAILADAEVMRALVAADDRRKGGNVVDLRGVAMDRLESRLGQLEDTHRTVIAAAYDTIAGTSQVHRAILELMAPADFAGFLATLGGTVADVLRLDAIRLVVEEGDSRIAHLGGSVLHIAPEGFVTRYAGPGRIRRPVGLRRAVPATAALMGTPGLRIASEALMPLDLGGDRLSALLAMGSCDPASFRPGQGTDLLAFFAGVFERTVRRWLA